MTALKVFLRPLYVPIANLWYGLFVGPRRYIYLFRTIRQLHAVRIAEVGTWTGGRASQMIAAAQKASPGRTIEYYGFDLFEGMTDSLFEAEVSKRPPSESEVTAKLSKTGAQIRLFKGDTKVTLPANAPSLPKMDFVYIDGGHHIDTIQSDWNAVEQLMHDKTVVIFDDYWHNRADAGCKAIIQSIDRTKYNVEVLPIVDSVNNEQFGRLDISFAKVSLR